MSSGNSGCQVGLPQGGAAMSALASRATSDVAVADDGATGDPAHAAAPPKPFAAADASHPSLEPPSSPESARLGAMASAACDAAEAQKEAFPNPRLTEAALHARNVRANRILDGGAMPDNRTQSESVTTGMAELETAGGLGECRSSSESAVDDDSDTAHLALHSPLASSVGDAPDAAMSLDAGESSPAASGASGGAGSGAPDPRGHLSISASQPIVLPHAAGRASSERGSVASSSSSPSELAPSTVADSPCGCEDAMPPPTLQPTALPPAAASSQSSAAAADVPADVAADVSGAG